MAEPKRQRGERGQHYRIQWRAGTQPVTVKVWQDFISRRLIRQIEKHLAVLAEGVRAFTTDDGKFDLEFAPTYRIRNSWQSWEIAWLFAVKGGMPANVAMMGLFAKQEYAIAEQQKDIDNEAAMWRISRAKAPKLTK